VPFNRVKELITFSTTYSASSAERPIYTLMRLILRRSLTKALKSTWHYSKKLSRKSRLSTSRKLKRRWLPTKSRLKLWLPRCKLNTLPKKLLNLMEKINVLRLLKRRLLKFWLMNKPRKLERKLPNLRRPKLKVKSLKMMKRIRDRPLTLEMEVLTKTYTPGIKLFLKSLVTSTLTRASLVKCYHVNSELRSAASRLRVQVVPSLWKENGLITLTLKTLFGVSKKSRVRESYNSTLLRRTR